MYGSETWAVDDDDTKRLEHAENSMVRWMCKATVRNDPTCEKVRSRIELKFNSEVTKIDRLP